ncbi:MAG: helix-turn-helix domain-containing protein [Candidatus Dojkabacteria bacterium]
MKFSTIPVTYTVSQVAEALQLSEATLYKLIKSGEIPAKRYGKAYRIPETELSFATTGLDYDIFQMKSEDRKNLPVVNEAIRAVRNG